MRSRSSRDTLYAALGRVPVLTGVCPFHVPDKPCPVTWLIGHVGWDSERR